jgi:type II secretory pathway component PulF
MQGCCVNGHPSVFPGEWLGALFRGKAKVSELQRLSYQLGLALDAGVDLRQACRREAARAKSPALRRHLEYVADQISKGTPFHEALRECGDFFPPLFVELVTIGELTGQLPETLLELSRHFEELLSRRRAFLRVISFPLVELGIALGIIGLLIWILGIIGDPYNPVFDPVGLGVVGTPGLVRYVTLLGLIGMGIWLGIRVVREGFRWVWPLQKLLLRIPGVGPAVKTLLMSQIAWALARTLGVGMEVKRAVRLSLSSTNHGQYLEQISPILEAVSAGQTLAEAFRSTGVFPDYFLDVLENSELAGRIPEAMDRLGQQLRERAIHAMQVLAVIAGWVIWAMIAIVIIFFIFRLASFYLGVLQAPLKDF